MKSYHFTLDTNFILVTKFKRQKRQGVLQTVGLEMLSVGSRFFVYMKAYRLKKIVKIPVCCCARDFM